MSSPSENEDNNNNSNDGDSNRPACAACKHQRKKCRKGCSFLLHFPASRHREFSSVHQIFGIANVNKMLKGMDLERQGGVVESIIWEAMVWTNNDHKEHGPYGLYRRLEQECKRLEEENKQLKEQLLKSQQELQSPSTPGTVFRSSWQAGNCSDVRGLSGVENYSSCSPQGNENLLLNSTVNSYSSLLEGDDKEAQRSISKGSHPPGLGFPAAPPPRSLSFQQDQKLREGRQEKGPCSAMLPLGAWSPAANSMLPQSASPGQARGTNARNLNISNFSCPSTPCLTSLEGGRFGRYNPYPLPGCFPPPMQGNGPQGGLILQYPFGNSTQNNNVSDQVNSNAAREEDNRHNTH